MFILLMIYYLQSYEVLTKSSSHMINFSFIINALRNCKEEIARIIIITGDNEICEN